MDFPEAYNTSAMCERFFPSYIGHDAFALLLAVQHGSQQHLLHHKHTCKTVKLWKHPAWKTFTTGASTIEMTTQHAQKRLHTHIYYVHSLLQHTFQCFQMLHGMWKKKTLLISQMSATAYYTFYNRKKYCINNKRKQ